MIAQTVLDALEGKGLSLALAESLTGGALADALVRFPGASKVFRGSVVAYATELKTSLLGVDAALLKEFGAVDSDVAKQMALGAALRLGADVAISTTGVAGPDEQDGKPVGLVFIAIALRGEVHVFENRFSGDRAAIRDQTVKAALTQLADLLTHR